MLNVRNVLIGVKQFPFASKNRQHTSKKMLNKGDLTSIWTKKLSITYQSKKAFPQYSTITSKQAKIIFWLIQINH